MFDLELQISSLLQPLENMQKGHATLDVSCTSCRLHIFHVVQVQHLQTVLLGTTFPVVA